jgi:CrcB protein
MDKLLAVGCGGFLGALMRYGMTLCVLRISAFQDCPIPLPTLLVNLSGCFLIGFLKSLADGLHWLQPTSTLFVFMGILGSFTTFSTFGFESWRLLENGRILEVFLYAILSVCLGIALVWLGYAAGGRLLPNA